ncbi:MAG TPA: hypothetical protein VM575_21120, partial [Nocardioides sp.]|nr:hypothetical protein [Nocardioides sp.]
PMGKTLLAKVGGIGVAIIGQATSMATVVVGVAHDNGDLERLVRERLAPFYASPEVAAILDGTGPA